MSERVTGRQDAKPQLRKPRANAFTPKKRQKFLDALALTCNVEIAATHAGVTSRTAYIHRARDPHFVAQWREALAAGYDRLEALVLQHGGAGQPLDAADPERAAAEGAPVPPFDFDRALALLRHHRSVRDGTPKAPGGKPRRNATREETNAALMKALAAAKRRMDRARKDG